MGGARASADFASLFRFVFLAGVAFLAVGLIAMLVVEERPLRGPSQRTPETVE